MAEVFGQATDLLSWRQSVEDPGDVVFKAWVHQPEKTEHWISYISPFQPGVPKASLTLCVLF
jgi:hypothetical protein